MKKPKRSATTVYLDVTVAMAAKVKAALTGKSLSDMVNDSLTQSLSRDAADLEIFRERRKEEKHARSYEDVVADMKRDGLL
ncbi:MAG: CopG family transcriptional regulator [Elusimicrobia bacterium]|nr:CopG family transcriptional regulator [Elusimicrobiota bacterium]